MKAVLMDLGNVISFFDYRTLETWLRQKGLDPNEVQRIYGRYSRDVHTNKMSPGDAWAKVNKLLGSNIVPSQFYEMRREYDRIDEKVLSKVREFRKRGIPVVLVTDLAPDDYKYFRSLPLWKEFDDHVVSVDVGCTKDEPAFWKFTLERIGCLPPQVLLIDDFTANLNAAASLRIQGIKYTKYEDIEKL